MSIAATVASQYTFINQDGVRFRRAVIQVTGLTGGASNTIGIKSLIPSDAPQIPPAAATPKAVFVNAWSKTGAQMAPPSLDGSTYPTGYDSAGNVYVITPAGTTQCELVVDY